jgi:hypothetical protein
MRPSSSSIAFRCKTNGEDIWKIFGDKVQELVPLFETEGKGAKMLNRLVEHLVASK